MSRAYFLNKQVKQMKLSPWVWKTKGKSRQDKETKTARDSATNDLIATSEEKHTGPYGKRFLHKILSTKDKEKTQP